MKLRKLTGVCLTLIICIGVFSATGIFAYARLSDQLIDSGEFSYRILTDDTIQLAFYRTDDYDVVIPSVIDGYTVTSLDNMFYAYSFDYISVTIPKTITEIENGAFGKSHDLMNIYVDDDNPSFCDIDGVLFSKDKTRLIMYPCARTGFYYMPDSTIVVKDSAFYGVEYLRGVVFSKNLVLIEEYGFAFCDNLRELEFNNGLSEIGEDAFRGCEKLGKVIFPTSITKIADNAFDLCDNVDPYSYYPSDSAWVVGRAFKKSKTIRDVEIPEPVILTVPETVTEATTPAPPRETTAKTVGETTAEAEDETSDEAAETAGITAEITTETAGVIASENAAVTSPEAVPAIADVGADSENAASKKAANEPVSFNHEKPDFTVLKIIFVSVIAVLVIVLVVVIVKLLIPPKRGE